MAWSWDLLRLEHCPFRQDTLAGVAPQGDQELSGESHDRDPPDPPATLPDTLAEPGAQGRVGLIAQPQPSELDHGVPQAWVAGLGDALFSVGRAALPWAWRQAGVRRHLSPVGEAAEQGFQPQPRAELGTNPLQAQ